MKLPGISKSLLLIAASGVLSTFAHGATITANVSDAEAHSDNTTTGAISNPNILAGNYSTGSSNLTAPVFAFLLPTLTVGQSFTASTATFTLSSMQSGTNFSANLVGLTRVDAAATVLGNDFSAASTALQSTFLTTASVAGAVVSIDISSWLNTQYAGGVNAGKYVFLRLDTPSDTGTTSYQGYNIASANNLTPANQPFLSYTPAAVPEPSAYGLIGASALAAVAMVRRRRKVA